MTTTQSTWPEGTLARYLTVGGATVDVSASHTSYEVGEHGRKPIGDGLSVLAYPETLIDLTVTAVCTGCQRHEERHREGLYPTALDALPGGCYGDAITSWAQSHAEACRAMPRPEATR